MFTPVSPATFVRAKSLERCENEGSLAAFVRWGHPREDRVQRSDANVCLTDKSRLDKA